jgi:hypothetical protein
MIVIVIVHHAMLNTGPVGTWSVVRSGTWHLASGIRTGGWY